MIQSYKSLWMNRKTRTQNDKTNSDINKNNGTNGVYNSYKNLTVSLGTSLSQSKRRMARCVSQIPLLPSSIVQLTNDLHKPIIIIGDVQFAPSREKLSVARKWHKARVTNPLLQKLLTRNCGLKVVLVMSLWSSCNT